MTKNLIHKTIAYFVISVTLLFSIPLRTDAWGPEGHRIVGKIAGTHLTEKARKEIAQLLDGTTLDSVANWADEIRRGRPETYRWHFVDIPIGANDYVPSRDCQNLRTGDCIIQAIDQFELLLADTTERKSNRAEALKFLVHFVGDLHQPLHCSDDNDRGGNDVKVKFFDKPMNLHSVWDSGIISYIGLGDVAYAARLDSTLTPQTLENYQKGTTVDWALESHALAVEYAYKRRPLDNLLGYAYFETCKPIVELQLKRAGARLAKVINNAFE
jgi:hypothetical protein